MGWDVKLHLLRNVGDFQHSYRIFYSTLVIDIRHQLDPQGAVQCESLNAFNFRTLLSNRFHLGLEACTES